MTMVSHQDQEPQLVLRRGGFVIQSLPFLISLTALCLGATAATSCEFMVIHFNAVTPLTVGLFSFGGLDGQLCGSYRQDSSSLSSAHQVARAGSGLACILGTITCLTIFLAFFSARLLDKRLWRMVLPTLLFLAAVFQLITFSMFGDDACTQTSANCSFGEGANHSLSAAILYIVMGVGIFCFPRRTSPLIVVTSDGKVAGDEEMATKGMVNNNNNEIKSLLENDPNSTPATAMTVPTPPQSGPSPSPAQRTYVAQTMLPPPSPAQQQRSHGLPPMSPRQQQQQLPPRAVQHHQQPVEETDEDDDDDDDDDEEDDTTTEDSPPDRGFILPMPLALATPPDDQRSLTDSQRTEPRSNRGSSSNNMVLEESMASMLDDSRISMSSNGKTKKKRKKKSGTTSRRRKSTSSNRGEDGNLTDDSKSRRRHKHKALADEGVPDSSSGEVA